MDPGILIVPFLFAAALAANPQSAVVSANPPATTAEVSTVRTDSVGMRRDTASTVVDSSKRARLKVLADSTPSWPIPARDASAGGALREAFRTGDPTAPWTRVFEYDGMWEDWRPWPSLPIEERAVRLSWTGPSLAGASDAGPLSVVAVARSTEPGFGGAPLRRELSAPSPVDTPLTQLQFWRGALASYQFGLDFERAVAGPWGIALRMETRSAQGKTWSYRDQIQDMFQGSFGRNREDLPASGRSPGQDDVQWESVISRATASTLIEAGYTWVDLHRGIPDPRHTWLGNDTAPYPGRDSRTGWFGRILTRRGDFSTTVSGRSIDQTWQRATWPDSGAPKSVSGSTTHQEGEGELSWGGDHFRSGVLARGALRTGTASFLSGQFQEDQERAGVYLAATLDSLQLRLDAGWNRLNDPLDRTHVGPDAAIQAIWSANGKEARLRLARELRLPDWELSVLPDPLVQSLPSRRLVSEGRWIAETRERVRILSWLVVDAGGAGVLLENAISPSFEYATDLRSAMVLANQTSLVYGWASQLGARAQWNGCWVASQWAVGMTMLPNGNRDPRYPALNSRTTLGWEGTVLAGRATVASSISLDIAGAAQQRTGLDTIVDQKRVVGATLVRIPPTADLAWENRFQIKTFSLFWRLQNLLDIRETPAAGWTPPGIRSGWGITWNFGG